MNNLSRNQILVDREAFSRAQLDSLGNELANLPDLRDQPDLCIYVTGSYGRLEASEHSDLDLFFVHTGKPGSMSHIEEILMKGALIKLGRTMGFPEFSGDGEYLQVHYLEPIRKSIGSRRDDFENYFTARLLLLLESQVVYNKDVYSEIIEKIIDSYLRDYYDHPLDFRPTFLVNDILRFWQTLCLNYEVPRGELFEDADEKNKSHLRNFKLKFSRLLTCFSMVLPLYLSQERLEPSTIAALVGETPLHRIRQASGKCPESRELWERIEMDYSWFLSKTGKPRAEVIGWIGDPSVRGSAFERAKAFGDAIFELLSENIEPGSLRYLVV